MIVGRIVVWHPAEDAPVIMQYTDINLYRLHLDLVHRSDGWLLIRGGVTSSHQLPQAPSHPLTLADLSPAAAASQGAAVQQT